MSSKKFSIPSSHMNNTSTIAISADTDLLVEKPRIASIDVMRGIVMVIMALDHVRDFFHQGAFAYNPTDMATTTPAIFFTRWITHYCAPAFVFLAGTSIFISSQRKSKKELSMFLLSRGLWLILLEVVVVRFGLFFNLYYDITVFQVIWVIGASMVCMAALIHLKYPLVLALGLLITLGHNLTDGIQLQPGDNFYFVWAFLHQTGFLNVSADKNFLVFYPLLPWLGIMILGYCLGVLYSKGYSQETRIKLLMRLGLIATGLFIIIRAINIYGDPAPWSMQANSLFTVMSFLNTTKYPVSLLYTLMTLGPVLIILSVMERIKIRSSILKPLEVFGRVPLFYYVLHFYLIHFVSLLLFMQKTGKSFSELDFHFTKSFGGITAEGGYALRWAYVIWILLVIALYPVCKWYNKYKSTHKQWWLSYV
jgi:uncharacterized membrane protein